MKGSFEISFSDCNSGSPIETAEEQSPGKVDEQEVVFRFCLDNTTTTPPPYAAAKAASNVPTSAYLAPWRC